MADVSPDERIHGVTGAVAVTPSDTVILEPTPRGLYIGGAGDVSVTWLDGSETVMTAALAGLEYGWQVTRVKSAGTTATNIIALY